MLSSRQTIKFWMNNIWFILKEFSQPDEIKSTHTTTDGLVEPHLEVLTHIQANKYLSCKSATKV